MVSKRRVTIRPAIAPPNTGSVIPRIMVSSLSVSDFGSGQPSSYPSGPFGWSGQLSSKSFTPSWSVSRSLFEHPSSSTLVVGDSGHLSGVRAPATNSPGDEGSLESFQEAMPQLSP